MTKRGRFVTPPTIGSGSRTLRSIWPFMPGDSGQQISAPLAILNSTPGHWFSTW